MYSALRGMFSTVSSLLFHSVRPSLALLSVTMPPRLCLWFTFFFLSPNLCQWSRLKGSVHVWTNPCVSDGLQPQSLSPAAQPASPRHALPLLLPLVSNELCMCVCECEHVYVSVAAVRGGQITALFFHRVTSNLTRLSPLFPLFSICPQSLLCTVAMRHGGCCLWSHQVKRDNCFGLCSNQPSYLIYYLWPWVSRRGFLWIQKDF